MERPSSAANYVVVRKISVLILFFFKVLMLCLNVVFNLCFVYLNATMIEEQSAFAIFKIPDSCISLYIMLCAFIF